MRYWLRGKRGGLLTFVLIATLVIGGLGWVTRAALQLNRLQREQQHEGELAAHLRVALWKLDRIASILAREDSRPFNHYSAVFVPALALDGRGRMWRPGSVVEPSPLLGVDLPEWMLLHFQISRESGWESPQVLSANLAQRLRDPRLRLAVPNVTRARQQLLAQLSQELPATVVLDHARKYAAETTTRDRTLLLAQRVLEQAEQNADRSQLLRNSLDYVSRSAQENRLVGKANVQNNYQSPYNPKVAELNLKNNGEDWLNNESNLVPPGIADAPVQMSPMVGLWLPNTKGNENLVLVRLVRVADQEYCQGIVLDSEKVRALLLAEVRSIFPEAQLIPVKPGQASPPERTMSALPFQLDPGPHSEVGSELSWTPLSIGLTLAWVAAGIALLAVGLGGWSLIDLSERRFRFVSAVTHELRTPLTTLRLYLDMLVNGMVRDENQRADYLRTLHSEADRLHRLIANVLDFSRLENQQARVSQVPVEVANLLVDLRDTWQARCNDAGKELIIDSQVPAGTVLWTDPELLQQVLGNLIDNACKYSKEAVDQRLWVRAYHQGRELVLEVEDRGPGVPRRESRSIFLAFRRGQAAETRAGGVGLGLALARRWAQLLHGKLTLVLPARGEGACFRVAFPRSKEG